MTEVFKKQKHQNTGQVSGQGSSDGALQNNLVVQRVMDTLYQFITSLPSLWNTVPVFEQYVIKTCNVNKKTVKTWNI